MQELLEQQKFPNLPDNGLFVFHFPAMRNESDWLFCFTVSSSLAWKKWDLEQKVVRFGNKSHC